MPGSTAQTNKFHTFYLQQRPDNGFTWADIKVNHPLDYETIKEYNLTIRVEVNAVFFVTIVYKTNSYYYARRFGERVFNLYAYTHLQTKYHVDV